MSGHFTISPGRAAISPGVSTLLKPYFSADDIVNQSCAFHFSYVNLMPGQYHGLAQFKVGPGGWLIQLKALVSNSDGVFLDLSAWIDNKYAAGDYTSIGAPGIISAMFGIQVASSAVIKADVIPDTQNTILQQVCISAIRQDSITTVST